MNARAFRDAVPGAGALSRSRAAQSLLRSWRRRRAVERPLAFAAHELLGARGRLGAYRLPGSEVVVCVRHRSRDVEILDEVLTPPFDYEEPAAVAQRLSRRGLRVLDLGGNVGLFAAWALDRYDVAELVSFEPDPTNLPILRRCRARNPAAAWTIVEACAGTAPGEVAFVAGEGADSRVAFDAATGTVTVPVVDVLPALRGDLVKIDIEGSEWDLLVDPRLAEAPVDVLVIEWHAHGCPAPDPFGAAVRALETAGFTVHGEDHGHSHGSLWAWRPEAVAR